jgi:hypothetical protein
MASEIRVDKINSLSGVGTVTLSPTGVDIAGITTAATLRATTGIVTTLTATESAKVGSGVTLSPDGDVFTTGITTSSSVIVGSGVTISESGIEASGIGITCASINGNQIGGRRNIIINGAMNVAQRGSAATTEQLYQTVDRMRLSRLGCDENPSQNQQSLGAGSAVYALGFTKSFRIVNGNQTSGAGSGDSVGMSYRIEARDIRSSGWDYTNPNSFITLQFWVYSNVGQTYYVRLRSIDGTSQQYVMSYTLSANTWTKVVKTIPGNSNIQFDDDVNQGLQITWSLFAGTNFTSSSFTLNSWAAYDLNSQFPDQTTTWFTTNDATWNITGLQLEVGPQATAFEHRTFGDELALCQRYYDTSYAYGTAPGTGSMQAGAIYSRYPNDVTNRMDLGTRWTTTMRAAPTVVAYSPSAGTAARVDDNGTGVGDGTDAIRTVSSYAQVSPKGFGGIVLTVGSDNTCSYHYTAQAEL